MYENIRVPPPPHPLAVAHRLDRKMTSQYSYFKFQNDTKFILVTFSTIFFLLFHLAVGSQRCPKI